MRRAVLATIPVLTVVLLHGPAVAAGPAGHVGPRDFPAVERMAAIFPYLHGGSRELYAGAQPSTIGSDCSAYQPTATQARGKVAVYQMPEEQDPYFAGRTSPTVGVYRFRSPQQARAALGQMKAGYRACYGNSVDDDGIGNRFTRLRVPKKIGRARFGIRQVHSDPNVGPDWFIDIGVTKGRYLIEVGLQRDQGAPKAKQAIKLAWLAVRSVG